MIMKSSFFLLLVILPAYLFAQDSTYQIKLEEEDLVILKHWIDQDGYILIDATFATHNHYFYLLNPEGRTITSYKNFFQNIFYKGFTSNEKEFTIYFSRTPNGEIHFLDFFKDGTRPAVSTVWTNRPKNSSDMQLEMGGTMFYFTFDKRKKQMNITSFDGPAAEFSVHHFAMQKKKARKFLKEKYYGISPERFFTPHFGSGLATHSDKTMVLLAKHKSKWTRYLFDTEDLSVKIDEHQLPKISDEFHHSSDAYICDNKIFFTTVSTIKVCLQVVDFDLKPLLDNCYNETTGIDFKDSDLLGFNGKPIDKKWAEKNNYNKRILRAIGNEMFGYINVFYHTKDNFYSVKMGGESPMTSSLVVGVPDSFSGIPTTQATSNPNTSTTFNGSLSADLKEIDRSNIFDQILKNTEMQFNNPHIIQKTFIALSKDFYYKINSDSKHQRLDVQRFSIE